MEYRPETPLAVTTPVKLHRFRKSVTRRENKRTIYKVHKFFRCAIVPVRAQNHQMHTQHTNMNCIFS